MQYIIGTDDDSKYKLSVEAPQTVYNTSEFCDDDHMYSVHLTVPETIEDGFEYTVHLYASNSLSHPYLNMEENYWRNLVPTWKFYDENKKIVENLKIKIKSGKGSAKFHYVDDMPNKSDSPIYIWVTLNLEETTLQKEKLEVNDEVYMPPSYSNSKLIAVTTTFINPLKPTKISITRDSISPISDGIYWTNQIIPFVATINSDHYVDWTGRTDAEYSSNLVYNYPFSENYIAVMTGNLGFTYTVPKSSSFDSIIEKYIYFTQNKWDEVSGYLPPENVLETSTVMPTPSTLEIMDWPTYNDLQQQYPDIPLDDYFIHHCNKCNDPEYEYEGPDENILNLDDYIKLRKEHKIFKYLPYALRIIDTLNIGTSGNTLYTSRILSSYYDLDELKEMAPSAVSSTEQIPFQLLDKRKNYNYKIGGYAFGKVFAPDTLGEDRDVSFYAESFFDNTGFERDYTFNILRFYPIIDGCGVMAADARTNLNENGKKTSAYILDNINSSYENVNKLSGFSITPSNPEHPIIIPGLVGPSCTVQDPGYNTWICDSDTNKLYKYDIENTQLLAINISDAITTLLTNEGDENKTAYWEKLQEETFVSPTSMVLDSQNHLYVTFFDTQMIVKFDGKTGEAMKVWFFQHGKEVPDNFDYSELYASGDLLQGYTDWKPAAIDTNEYDDVVILFQTRFPDDLQDFDDGVTPLNPSLKLVFMKDDEITDQLDIDLDDADIYNTHINDNQKDAKNKIDTQQVLFRSTITTDYVYFCGSIQALNGEEKYDRAFLWRFSKPRTQEKWSEPPSGGVIKTFDSSGPYYHTNIDHMFMDVDNNLWFALNEENRNPYERKSTLMCLRNARSDSTSFLSIPLSDSPIIEGISQDTNYDLLIADRKGKAIKAYDTRTGRLIEWKTISIRLTPEKDGLMGGIFTNGDWSGAEFVNKYLRKMYAKLETIPEENTIKVHCYDNYYIRKHSEEWDVAEHMKIPVLHTPFVDENPDLFKTIGITLGIDEHKNYSIGKKLFEGIANQVANIHDMDECHINNIYYIADKEDVNMDTFINAYPEELKRMTDLLSIKRKKLWGDRCHCTQNYFKTVNKDHPRYCPKCKHWHTTNLGDNFDLLNNKLMCVIDYLSKYDGKFTDERWYYLAEAICAQSAVMSFLFNVSPEIECNKKEINTALEAIVPVNKMLDVVEDVLHLHYDRLDDENNSYDVLHAIKFIDDIIRKQPICYITEDKFNRDTFFKITASLKSIEEASHILDLMKEGKFLDENDILLMSQGKTNDKIILFISIINLEEEVKLICYKRPDAIHDEYEDPKNMYGAVKVLNSQIDDLNDIFFSPEGQIDPQHAPIPHDSINTSKQFAVKAVSVVDKLEDEIKENVKEISDDIKKAIERGESPQKSWRDILKILREFNRIIYENKRDRWMAAKQNIVIPRYTFGDADPEDLDNRIRIAQILAIHTQFFVPDHWFNYCFWYFINKKCETLNTSVINWDSKYTTLPEYDKKLQDEWYKDQYNDNTIGTMEKLLNYILHNGTLFHENEIYVDD